MVAITGIGMITPLGLTTGDCWSNLVKGKSGIRCVDRFDTRNCLTKIGGQIPDSYFDLERLFFSPEEITHSILPTRLAIMASHEAFNDASFPVEKADFSRHMAVIVGSGGSVYNDDVLFSHDKNIDIENWNSHSLDIHPLRVAARFGCEGPAFNVATACSSGAFALALGFDYVRQNQHPCLVVGLDCTLLIQTFKGFNSLMALSEWNEDPEKASRPFDKKRKGFVMSEGACSILLEPRQAALARNARIYAFLSGYATISEAHNIIAPEPNGFEMARTMLLALKNAGISKESVGYINAHGTSTIHNDLAETRGIKRVFGDKAYKIPVSSSKSMMGHSIGAAGAIEAAVTALSLHHQVLTPTINLDHPDPECDLDYVPHQSRKVDGLTAALSNSFGFGGHNCTLVLESNVQNGPKRTG